MQMFAAPLNAFYSVLFDFNLESYNTVFLNLKNKNGYVQEKNSECLIYMTSN